MITLVDICSQLDKILNGTDPSVTEPSPANEQYFFRVFTEGLYLTDIYDKKDGRNFIPVVVGALGGEYNPVPELEETDLSVKVVLYYPVRFKDDFYKLNDFLIKVFVGKQRKFGTINYALCNISVAQYGELQDIDFHQFDKWINNTFKQANPYVAEVMMAMEFTLYLSTAKGIGRTSSNGFIYGNDWKTKLTIHGQTTTSQGESDSTLTQGVAKTLTLSSDVVNFSSGIVTEILYDNVSILDEVSNITFSTDPATHRTSVSFTPDNSYSGKALRVYMNVICDFLVDENPVFVSQTDVLNATPTVQQSLDGLVSLGAPLSTAYSKELPIYIRTYPGYELLVESYLKRWMQTNTVTLEESCSPLFSSKTYKRIYYITNATLSKVKGQLLSMTLTLADHLDNGD